jgi:uncharacterized protein YjiS (DUF1127 family)
MEMIMSSIFNAPAVAQGIAQQSPAHRAVTALIRWWVAYTTWRIEQSAIARLGTMNDRELKDIGISRSAIRHAVTNEVAWDRQFRGCS